MQFRRCSSGKSNNIISYGILGCKCVYAEPIATWEDLIFVRENFGRERHGDRLRIRPDHPYYYPLIALVGILDLSWIDICRMKDEDIYIERLINDENIWCTIKENVHAFY